MLINEKSSRFELNIDDKIAFIDYKIGKSGKMYLIHTEVPEDIGQKGIGSKLVKETLDYLKSEGTLIVPSCPFIRRYLKKHPGVYDEIIAPGIEI